MRKARLLCLTDKYEYDLISSTGKNKEDYIGQVGNIVHVHKMLTGNGEEVGGQNEQIKSKSNVE